MRVERTGAPMAILFEKYVAVEATNSLTNPCRKL
jgi:hypothetical protein